MAPEQRVVAVPARAGTRLVGLQQDADVEVLDGCALKLLKVLCPRVRAAAEARVDAVDDPAGFKLPGEKVDAVIDQATAPGVIGKLCSSLVPIEGKGKCSQYWSSSWSSHGALLTVRLPPHRRWTGPGR